MFSNCLVSILFVTFMSCYLLTLGSSLEVALSLIHDAIDFPIFSCHLS
jgi:hypothetical protein